MADRLQNEITEMEKRREAFSSAVGENYAFGMIVRHMRKPVKGLTRDSKFDCSLCDISIVYPRVLFFYHLLFVMLLLFGENMKLLFQLIKK